MEWNGIERLALPGSIALIHSCGKPHQVYTKCLRELEL